MSGLNPDTECTVCDIITPGGGIFAHSARTARTRVESEAAFVIGPVPMPGVRIAERTRAERPGASLQIEQIGFGAGINWRRVAAASKLLNRQSVNAAEQGFNFVSRIIPKV